MIEEPLQLTIKILDKEYRIACEFHEQDDLKASARLLDSRMREIRQTGRVVGTDRIAIMAALNIAYDLIQLQRACAGTENELNRRLQQLQERVNRALAGEPEIEEQEGRIEGPSPAHQPPLDAPREKV